MDEFTPPPMPAHDEPRRLRTYPDIAWGFIIFFVIATMAVPRLLGGDESPGAEDGGVLLQVQGKILVAGGDSADGFVRRMYIRQAVDFDTGSIGQRQRAIILIADVGGPDLAADHLAQLDELIEEHTAPDAERPIELTEEQRRVQEILRVLYGPEPLVETADADRPRIESLDQPERDFLTAELGWLGELALMPPEGDRRARRDFLRGPMMAAMLVSLVFLVLIVLGLAGAVGLIVLFVFALQGRLGRGLAPGAAHHGIYAETFACWMALFLGLQIAGALAGALAPDHALFIMFIAFFWSLAALAWPLMRGVPWSTVRRDVGLTLGRGPLLEGAIGAGGYAMALPMFVVGVLIMLVLMAVDMQLRQVTGAPADPFAPQGVPAHPVFDALQQPGMWIRIQLLLVAAVAAPIVEEIMFRGVLYRHLRDALRSPWLGAGLPILGSAAITAFIFAIIHPVPWFAWPGLMALAIAFALAREWRGTIFPSIVMHAIHNAVIVSFVIVILSA